MKRQLRSAPTVFGFLWILPLLIWAGSPIQARDLAGIPWKDFVARSEFVFAGTLVKAEVIEPPGPDTPTTVRYTFRIGTVFKGPALKEVTVDVPPREFNEGIPVQRMGILALKQNRDAWVLSVDQRSWWPHHNEMKADFGGLPVYEIPTGLLHDYPKELGESNQVKRLYEDGYHLKNQLVYPRAKVDRLLGKYLTETRQPIGTPAEPVQTKPTVTSAAQTDLSREISAILKECEQLTVGKTRAELLKVFTTEGGLATAKQRTYVHRRCAFIKVNVEFMLSAPDQSRIEERPTDTISRISQPYLQWSVAD